MSAIRFFFKYAGFSYKPDIETAIQGRWRCARKLAAAEVQARERGWSFEWLVDHAPDLSWIENADERARTVAYGCVMRDRDGSVLDSLWGIALADNSLADPYCRVVEAELASETAEG